MENNMQRLLNMLKLSNGLWVQTCGDIAGLIMPPKGSASLTVASHESWVYTTGKWDIICNVTNG